jgi:hypothetical protein
MSLHPTSAPQTGQLFELPPPAEAIRVSPVIDPRPVPPSRCSVDLCHGGECGLTSLRTF